MTRHIVDVVSARKFISLLASQGYRDYKFVPKSFYYSRDILSKKDKNICATRISVVCTSQGRTLTAETMLPPIGEIVVVPTCNSKCYRCYRATTKGLEALANPVTCDDVHHMAEEIRTIIRPTTKTILLVGSCCDVDIWSTDRIAGILHPRKVLNILRGLGNKKFEKRVKEIGIKLAHMGVLEKQGMLT
jgi:hypothetical protein